MNGAVLTSPTPARRNPLSEHICCAYSSDDERAAIASEWLAEGRRLGQRALYVADAGVDDLVRELAALGALGDVAGALASGSLVVMTSGDVYDLSAPTDADAQLRMYAGAVDAAVRDGFTGLRVAADITPLVADASRRDAHLRWEQVADRYIAHHPLAPACMYDTRRIHGIGAIVCAHPRHRPRRAVFSMAGLSATEAALEGEVDGMVADVLAEVLGGLPASDAVIDVSDLAFVDGRCAWALERELARREAAGQAVRLRGASRSLRRVWGLCGFDPAMLHLA